MSKGPCTFRKSDVKRAFEAAASAGVKVSVEIDQSGNLKLVPLSDASEAHEEACTETMFRGRHG